MLDAIVANAADGNETEIIRYRTQTSGRFCDFNRHFCNRRSMCRDGVDHAQNQ